MARTPLLLFILALLALGPRLTPGAHGQSQDSAGNATDFEKGHLGALEQSRKGDWRAARTRWLKLLRAHAGAPYAQPFLPEIREALRRAAFWQTKKRPGARKFVSGKLDYYSAGSGNIKVSYTMDNLDDFEQVANFQLHPLFFSDTYTIEAQGTPTQLSKLSLILAYQNGSGYLLQIGVKWKGSQFWNQHSLAQFGDGKSSAPYVVEPKVQKSHKKKIKLKVTVSPANIEVTYAKDRLFSIPNASSGLGQFGLLEYGQGEDAISKLVISGKAGRAWIEELIDASVQEEMQAFQESYAAPVELAAWDVTSETRKSSPTLSELARTLTYPENYSPEQIKELERIDLLISSGQHKEALAQIRGLSLKDWNRITKEYLKLSNALWARNHPHALAAILKIQEIQPLSSELQAMEILLNLQMERLPQALQLLERQIEREPNNTTFQAHAAQLLLLKGDLDAARTRVDKALAQAPGDPELIELRSQVAKASQGPSWKTTRRKSGESFEVATDIDARTTNAFAREADRALAHYVSELGELPSPRDKRKLFVFSGSSSYLNYIKGVERESPENTVGLFSGRLKQILLWNQPDEAYTKQVIRHEVMHSYTDVLLGQTPIWFAEGLAEYWSHAKQADGNWTAGLDVGPHLRAIKHFGLERFTVQQLITMEQDQFMLNAEYCYPVSWALVDYLLNSSALNQSLFDGLWQTLQGEIDPLSAVLQVFDKVDLEEFNQLFWADLDTRLP